MSRSPCRVNHRRTWAALGLALAFASPLTAALKIGWAQADITPPEPVIIAGQFHAFRKA